MFEGVRWSWSRLRGPLLALSLFTASTVVAACTENLEGGAACPALCPEQSEQFRDTTIDAVALDSSVGGFPALEVFAVTPDGRSARWSLAELLPAPFTPASLENV